jgi:hypothetical protein
VRVGDGGAVLFARATRGLGRVSRERPDHPSCSQNAHGETGGNGTRVVPCSRSAHDQNVLARRAQWTTTDAIPRVKRQASLEGSLRGMVHRSMRAVKDDLATLLREDVERVAEEEGPRLGQGRVLARPGWAGEKVRAVEDNPTIPSGTSKSVGRGRWERRDAMTGLFARATRGRRRPSLDAHSRARSPHPSREF